jgi:putative ABC transport system ATP-binding protein
MVTHEPDMAEYARTIVHFRDGLVESVEQKGARVPPSPFLRASV